MWIILCLSILLASCSLSKKLGDDKTNLQSQHRDLIGFLVLKIEKDTVRGKNVIELVSKTISSGKVKSEPQEPSDFEDYLTIEVFDRNKLVNTIIIEHPLHKHVEYADEDGKLATKLVDLDRDEFFVRFQLTGDSNTIRISETLKNSAKRELKTIRM
jgi:hypothetical protein